MLAKYITENFWQFLNPNFLKNEVEDDGNGDQDRSMVPSKSTSPSHGHRLLTVDVIILIFPVSLSPHKK